MQILKRKRSGEGASLDGKHLRCLLDMLAYNRRLGYRVLLLLCSEQTSREIRDISALSNAECANVYYVLKSMSVADMSKLKVREHDYAKDRKMSRM